MWRPSRRELLAAAAALALPACGDNEAGGAGARFAGLPIGVQSWTWRVFPLAEALQMTADLGLPRIELCAIRGHLPFPSALEEMDAVRAQLAGLGLACLTTTIEPAGPAPDQLRAVFEHAARLGARTNMMDAPPAYRDELAALAREYGIRVGIHNHTASAYTRIEHVLEVIDGRPELGAIIDTGHFTREGVDPVEAIYAFAGRIVGMHLKDVVAPDPAAPDAILGQGVVDIAGVLRALREVGFPADATISIEYESNPEAPYDDMAAAVAYAAAVARATR